MFATTGFVGEREGRERGAARVRRLAGARIESAGDDDGDGDGDAGGRWNWNDETEESWRGFRRGRDGNAADRGDDGGGVDAA